MFHWKQLATTAFILATAVPAVAADQDTQVWTAVNASVDVSKKVIVALEGQARFTDDVGRLGQASLRPSIGYRIGKNTTATLGYAYVDSDPVGPARSQEHRVWQQMAYRIAVDGTGLTLTGRTRLEQRWMEGNRDMGWRLRQQVRLALPLVGKTKAFVWSEPFFNLDDTSWGQRSGLDRVRNSFGLSIPLSKVVTIEPGYINQWQFRTGADRIYHIGNVSLSARF